MPTLSDRAIAMVLLHDAIERGKGIEAIRILNAFGYGTGARYAVPVDWPKARTELQRIVDADLDRAQY